MLIFVRVSNRWGGGCAAVVGGLGGGLGVLRVPAKHKASARSLGERKRITPDALSCSKWVLCSVQSARRQKRGLLGPFESWMREGVMRSRSALSSGPRIRQGVTGCEARACRVLMRVSGVRRMWLVMQSGLAGTV